jgi:hypothetical protein
VRSVSVVWDEGDYTVALDRSRRRRAERRSEASVMTLDKLFRRATRNGRHGKTSRMCVGFMAPTSAPGHQDVLDELEWLVPSLFVPEGCPRRARIAERVAVVSKCDRIKFEEQHLVPAVYSMPKSTTTWATTGLMKVVICTKEGMKQMTFLLGLIVNAEVPPEVRPLFFDSKRVALEKLSQHQLSIERLVMQAGGGGAEANVARDVGEADATSALRALARPELCARCGHEHLPTVSCAPAIWVGESPDAVPTGVLRQPTVAELQLGAQALVKPHPRLACCVEEGERCCEECWTAPERVQHPSSTKRPIDIPSVEMKMVERALVFGTTRFSVRRLCPNRRAFWSQVASPCSRPRPRPSSAKVGRTSGSWTRT